MKKEVKLDLSGGIKRLKILTNQIVNTRFIGSYKSVFRGRGLEFKDYRSYSPNDDAAMIDWKASVKSKQLLVKQFEEERNLNIFFLIDVSSSMVYGTGDKLKMEYVGEIAATLSFGVLNSGDSIGFILFADKIIESGHPTTGPVQYHNLVKALVNPNNYGGKYDLNEALKYTLSTLKESSIVIILSDFIGLKSGWERYIKMISRKFDLIGIMVRDPRDETLPEYSGQAVLEDPYSGKQILVRPELIEDDYKKYVSKQEQILKNTFLKANADFVGLTTDKSFVKAITNLFMKRALRHK
tara:strand:- start:623 stop:1513 length:891 start_codon:yes stop_codon:yes gene_type:complete